MTENTTPAPARIVHRRAGENTGHQAWDVQLGTPRRYVTVVVYAGGRVRLNLMDELVDVGAWLTREELAAVRDACDAALEAHADQAAVAAGEPTP